MAYIGNAADQQAFTPAIDYFNGNGSNVAFTLSRPVASVAQVQAVIENVPQNPGNAFTVSGNTITFTSAPPSGTNNIYVYYTSPITQVIQPGQGTVGLTQLNATGTPSVSNYLRGDNSWAAIASSQWTTTGSDIYYNTGNVGIGNTSPGVSLQVTGGIRARGGAPGVNGVNNNGYAFSGNSGDTDGGMFSSADGTVDFYADSAKVAGFIGPTFQFNSGYGSVATAFGCRAWVNFNGTGTVAIRSSGNVSSITDNGGVGDYTINFTTAMPDANYAIMGTASRSTYNAGNNPGDFGLRTAPTTSSFRICTSNGGLTNEDSIQVDIAIFR
jgi:hypothetical protein